MLRHIVMWKFKPEAEGKTKRENALWMKEHLEALIGKIPQLISAEVGINEKESEASFDAVLTSTFATFEDLEAYKKHPLHQDISTYCKKVRLDRVVCDYWEDEDTADNNIHHGSISLSKTISIRPLMSSDAKAIFHTIDNHRNMMRRWLPFVDFTLHPSDSITFVKQSLKSEDKVFSILDRDSFIGLIGLKNIDMANKRGEIGYWLSPEYHNKGIMTMAAQKVLHFAFTSKKLNRVQIRCAVDNIASQRIPEKLGFHLEGIERGGELLNDDSFIDLKVYSILQNEFINK